MKLEQQVTSLEISKRLKELGVKQESYFQWYELYGDNNWTLAPLNKSGNNTVSAFTVAELGEMLPDYVATDHLYSLQQTRNWTVVAERKLRYHISYWFLGKEILHSIDDDSEANARGKMLIYLLENNLLTLTKDI